MPTEGKHLNLSQSYCSDVWLQNVGNPIFEDLDFKNVCDKLASHPGGVATPMSLLLQ